MKLKCLGIFQGIFSQHSVLQIILMPFDARQFNFFSPNSKTGLLVKKFKSIAAAKEVLSDDDALVKMTKANLLNFRHLTTCTCRLVSVKQEYVRVFCYSNKKLTILQ